MSKRELPRTEKELIEGLAEGRYTTHQLMDGVKADPEFKAMVDELMGSHNGDFSDWKQEQGSIYFKQAVKNLGLTIQGIETATDAELDQTHFVAEVGPYLIDIRVKAIHNMNDDEYRSFREQVKRDGGLPSYGLVNGETIIN